MDLKTVLHSYKSGNFSSCIQFYNEVSYKSETLPIECEISKTVLYRNNTTVCQSILELSKPSYNWLELMTNFIKLHSNYRSVPTVPLELELNVVYNTLWWFCVKPTDMEFKTNHLQSVLNVVSKSVVKVLIHSGETVLGHDLCSDDVTNVVNLVKRASDQLLQLSPLVCAQLLSVITMTVQVLLRQVSVENSTIVDCLTMLTTVVDQLDILRRHMRPRSAPGSEEVFFKFGLTDINSTASLDNVTSVVDALVITCSLVGAVVGEFKQSIDCLKEVKVEDNPFQFLINYMKAYCWLQIEEYGEAKLCLAYTRGSVMSTQYQGHYQLLLARVQSAQGGQQAALALCDRVLASAVGSHRLVNLAAHLAATVAHSLHVVTAQLYYLKELVKSLRQSLVPGPSQFEGFEECCLSILTDQFYVSLPEAVYVLARQLYLAGYHIKALESYEEVVELLKTEITETTELLPPKAQVVHEAILSHIRANRLLEGEQLCRQMLREHVPQSTSTLAPGEPGCWEAILATWDEDVLAMVLLADILAPSDKKKAMGELTRCYNTVCEMSEQCQSGTVQRDLCDWFASRTLLRKARLSIAQDAAHYFRRALIHKPGDKEVVYHYKQWALWHPDHESFDPGDSTVQFPTDQLTCLALSHVLGCSVTQEEWANLCGSDTSLNIVDTLFDDDD